MPFPGAAPTERHPKEELDMPNILLEKKGLIAVATINRPKALNALNSEVLTDLDELGRGSALLNGILNLRKKRYAYLVV